jgi:hypothetical protein
MHRSELNRNTGCFPARFELQPKVGQHLKSFVLEIRFYILCCTGQGSNCTRKLYPLLAQGSLIWLECNYLNRPSGASVPCCASRPRERCTPFQSFATKAPRTDDPFLRAGVDLVTISDSLGHATVERTNPYAAIDLENKSKVLSPPRNRPERKAVVDGKSLRGSQPVEPANGLEAGNASLCLPLIRAYQRRGQGS